MHAGQELLTGPVGPVYLHIFFTVLIELLKRKKWRKTFLSDLRSLLFLKLFFTTTTLVTSVYYFSFLWLQGKIPRKYDIVKVDFFVLYRGYNTLETLAVNTEGGRGRDCLLYSTIIINMC